MGGHTPLRFLEGTMKKALYILALVIGAFVAIAPSGAMAGGNSGGNCGAAAVCSNPDANRTHTWGAPKKVYHRVAYCFVPGKGTKGNRIAVPCSSPRTRYKGADGHIYVCFTATDGREYHVFYKYHGMIVVTKGQRFFNRRTAGGHAIPDWPHLD